MRADGRHVYQKLPKPFRALLALLATLLPAITTGQPAYPNHPIRMIVPFAAGGTSDVLARIIGPPLGEILGQPIIIQNRAGASGNIGMDAAAKALPDGYTIFLGNIGTIAINPAIFRELSVNPARDFTPVTLVADVAHALVVNPNVPVKSVAELIAWAKANPGVLNFATTGSGSLSHLEMEQFRRSANLDVVHIPYKGGAGPALTGMLGGETHALFVTLASGIGYVQSGRLRALGISTPRRIAALPDVPTMAEAGFPDMISGSWQGIFVPAGTPRPIVDRLHAAIVATLAMAETNQRLIASEVTVVTSGTPDEFAAFVNAEILRWSKVVKESGATLE
jgi:tripartite-type tricarboxylate transporter receptor subunit TctC